MPSSPALLVEAGAPNAEGSEAFLESVEASSASWVLIRHIHEISRLLSPGYSGGTPRRADESTADMGKKEVAICVTCSLLYIRGHATIPFGKKPNGECQKRFAVYFSGLTRGGRMWKKTSRKRLLVYPADRGAS